MFKKLRILFLLSVLLVVAVGVYRDKNQDWDKPIYVAVYPINPYHSPAVDDYIHALRAEDFKQIETYLHTQSLNYGKNVKVYFRLGGAVKTLPPTVPQSGRMMDAIIWSLKFRYYAYKHASDVGVPSDLRLFLQYYDPKGHSKLTHTSTALQNGRIGVVHLFASSDKTANNNVVIAHESLHAFGASDKYDLATGQPIFPIGYASPAQNPRYPQRYAELMAMHKATSPSTHQMARTLGETVIGQATAIEIGWQKPN